MLDVMLPDDPDPALLGELPAEVRVATFDADRRTTGALERVQFFVPPPIRRADVLEALPRMRALEVIQTLSAGVDWLTAELPRGVTLCDAAGVHDASVSEWVMAAILAMAKDLPRAAADQRARYWRDAEVDDLQGKTVLTVGHGSIGRALEERLAPFRVHMLRVARHARAGVHAVQELPALLGRADVVVVLVALTDATSGLIGAPELAAMRPGALLVNAARGPVVDTDALLAALRAGHIRAALDVVDPEPLPGDHPLWEAPGLLLTPHQAGRTPLFPARAYALVRRQIERRLAGEPLVNVVRDGY